MKKVIVAAILMLVCSGASSNGLRQAVKSVFVESKVTLSYVKDVFNLNRQKVK
jgi:hypothetical protein